jgi:hypothetical protein
VGTENPSVCAMVDWKLCKSAIALYLSVIKRTCNQGAKNPIIQTRNRYFCHTYNPTHDSLEHCIYPNIRWHDAENDNQKLVAAN